MKRELKDIILISTIAFFLALGLTLGSLFISFNVFGQGKSVTIKINYANHSYEYKYIKTEADNLYKLLLDYDEKLALRLSVAQDNETTIYSLKGTDINPSRNYYYYVDVNGSNRGVDLSAISIFHGDIITINFSKTTPTTFQLVNGGDNRLTYYSKILISLNTIAALILIPAILYLIVSLIRYRENNRIGVEKVEKKVP